jgi:hypothetical protein
MKKLFEITSQILKEQKVALPIPALLTPPLLFPPLKFQHKKAHLCAVKNVSNERPFLVTSFGC